MELHFLAQVVAARLAVLARSARDSRFQSHVISTRQFFHSRPDLFIMCNANKSSTRVRTKRESACVCGRKEGHSTPLLSAPNPFNSYKKERTWRMHVSPKHPTGNAGLGHRQQRLQP